MRNLFPWLILIALFVLAAGGINLIRIGSLNAMAGIAGQWWRFALGTVMTLFGTAYLGGFIYYRDKKRGRVRKPNWRQ